MSETNGYQSAIREIGGKVTMQFYENSSDNDADLSLVETAQEIPTVTDTGTEWRSYASNRPSRRVCARRENTPRSTN